MRIMIKGGVWKNTEDEILKAAVMKYGLNQWARISSLLVRKSAKQCKARWYEWLDPSIKKTEWTREEDEKLLHLAKLMPTQWRTIAPIVGRTPAQCLERYEKLLDAAAAKDDTYDPADDPRRLRPGEIDPNPEAKPARPDPIDMDEDEKEMLSEARARLANTRGKKAKRKAREKQLEEARRLASLQKKRELKAAGIEMRARDRRRRGVDYNQEVAFEKVPAQGFYDTAAEKEMAKELGKEFRPLTLEEMEGRRRKDIEANLAKKDAERDRIKERHDQPGAVAKDIELNDPAMVSRRRRMMLPAPQISEAELQAIARGETNVDLDGELAEGAGGEATRRLLGDYQTPGRAATPMRTPRSTTAGGADRITQEAQNLARLQSGQTPLMGGANPELHPSDFAGVTPRSTTAATPHPMATPQMGASPFPGATPGATPSGGRSVAGVSSTPMRTPLIGGKPGPGATPMRTPLRDALGLNDPGATPGALVSRRDERQREAAARAELREGLMGLPAPQNEYQIMVPENEAEAAEGDGLEVEEDAAEADARRKAAAKAAEEAELKKRSQVVQRGLPRPLAAYSVPEAPSDIQAGVVSRQMVEQLIAAEMAALLAHENLTDPLPSKEKKDKKDRKRRRGMMDSAWQEISHEEMQAAADLLTAEMEEVKATLQIQDVDQDEFAETWETSYRDFIYLPDKGLWGRKAGVTNSDRLNSIQAEFKGLKEEMLKEAQRGAKLEAKVAIVMRGHQDRHSKLDSRLQYQLQQARSVTTDLTCFRALQQREELIMPERRATLEAEVAEQQEYEHELQARYKQLNDELQDLNPSHMLA